MTENNTNTNTENNKETKTAVDYTKSREALQEKLQAQMEEYRKKNQIALEAISEGKGRLTLAAPITYNDEEITELAYDFTALTGMEYADAMDSDASAQQIFRITNRQGLALFAAAAAKQTPELDSKEIMENLGVADAMEGVQLATSFFAASTRAGRMRISKR